ncbi:hypothetical protein [Stutzerimonas stutzeri]|uniref:hypothetical protein n=1 Tax=Stutzerimonas stutzeri TaxID=316 RepID=UPI00210C4B1C|nr:hypothetical protein [Stutzerimonas stutzeri]MCQ4321751.1 hypothetical protein [Stutzerimonas stutzeri]
MKINSRVAVLDLGMYIFRYSVPAGDTHRRSYLSLHQSPIGKGSVDFFPGEGVSRNTLTAPGDCVIVRVKGAQASVLVTEYHPENESNRIHLRLDKIDTSASLIDPKPIDPKPIEQKPIDQQAGACELEWLGHIETRGDVSATSGWLGDPNTARRLEGFSANWLNKPDGLDLAYLCRAAKGTEPQVGLAGTFVGTRRKAKPITSVAFALSGQSAADHELTGQVVFAGSPPLTISPDKELSGPNGTEQLVAIRVVVTPRAAQASSPASPWTDPVVAQIFRSK